MQARILLTAPKSGSGKTVITCGLLALLKRLGKMPVAVKCGPDYIDPMFHRSVLGIPSGNLDTYFTNEMMTRALLCRKMEGAGITVLEGAMGYYDGLAGMSVEASAYDVARTTNTPAILILDAKGASVSLGAVAKGMKTYREDSNIKGIILNRVSPMYFSRIKSVIEADCGLPVLGYLPDKKEYTIPSRHLGLVAPEEMEEFARFVEQVADGLEETLDLEALFAIAEEAPELTAPLPELPKGKPVRIAVARDEAFSFYYEENLELLKSLGAELCFFSPIHDVCLPEHTAGLILGGGYPELFIGALEANASMRASIKEALKQGMPCLAECGGFLYLQDSLEGQAQEKGAMVGGISGAGFPTGKLKRFGYMEATFKHAGMFGGEKTSLRGHEFHHWDSTENGSGAICKKPLSKISYEAIHYSETMAAGFPHFYYYSNVDAISHFLHTCRSFYAGIQAKKHWDAIAKPIDSLGLMEDYVVKLCKIKECLGRPSIEKKALVVFCADHGVLEEGVTQTGKEVTRIVAENFAKGCSTVNYMAKKAGVDVFCVDVGMDTENYPCKELVTGQVVDQKVARGTKNLLKEAAMTREECLAALQVGIDCVGELKKQGYEIIAMGEMGIGNTTPTSVLAGLLFDKTGEAVTGKGAGLSKEKLRHKCEVVQGAIDRILALETEEPVEVLRQGGGLELAAMAGLCLGGVLHQMPIVLDGAISTVSACVAKRIDSRVVSYLLPSHVSGEGTGAMALENLGLETMIHGRLCLGEGTGAMAFFPLLDMALYVYEHMGTFGDYQIEEYKRY